MATSPRKNITTRTKKPTATAIRTKKASVKANTKSVTASGHLSTTPTPSFLTTIRSMLRKIRVAASHHKLVTFLSLLCVWFAYGTAYNAYQKWDNAQLIKGIARDFPLIVQEIEGATGLDLEQTTNCMTTTEKSGGGVRTCELTIESFDGDNIVVAKDIVKNSAIISSTELSKYGNGLDIYYRNREVCYARTADYFIVTCTVEVKDGNVTLAKEVFNK